MTKLSIPDSTLPHVFVGKGIGGGMFTATLAEMAAWEAKPFWWRLTHPGRAPWNQR